MRSDLPAALPLLFLTAGLTAGPLLVNPRTAMAGACAVAVLLLGVPGRLHATTAFLFLAGGIALARGEIAGSVREAEAFRRLDPDRFAVIEVPLEGGWSESDGTFVLRASRFRANGFEYDEPIRAYARFPPPPQAMHAEMQVEGVLRHGPRGWSVSVKSPRLLRYAGAVPRWHPASWNRALAQRLAPHAARHPDEVALAEALALGRGERLDEEMRESFRRGGTYHLLVFSGLQIALAAAALAALLRWLHAPRAADWLLLAFALVAPPFIGPTASVSRASIGIGLYAVSRIARRPTSIPNLWCVAALLRLVFVPEDLADASFHLTFAGAGALIFLGRPAEREKRRSRLAATARYAAAVETAIAPLTLFHFHQVTVGGSLVTLAMSPVMFAMLIVSAIACALPLDVCFEAIGVLNGVCGALNSAGLSAFYAAPPHGAMLVAAFGALAALALSRGRLRPLLVALALLVPTASAVVRSHSARNAEVPSVAFFDVGQGDAIAIRSGRTTILVDGGPKRRILPLLADRGIRRVDLVILTHAHPDHCEGLAAVVSELGAGAVRVSPHRFRGACAARIIEATRRTRTPLFLLRDGERLELGDLSLEVALAGLRFRRAAENNSSAVLRLTAGGRTFLLTGDIEREAELALSDRDLRADVLKVAHHGSRSSTSTALLEAVRPRTAVISCGRANPFGHPHAGVLERLRQAGVRTWRTDRNGTVEVEVREGRLLVRSGGPAP